METLIKTAEFLAVVIVATFLIDRACLRLLVRVVSSRALARHRRKAGGSNRLVLHGLNNAANCRTPLSVADAVVSFCVFDVTRLPLRLHAHIPPGKYWSLTCYGMDTTNFYSLNDQQLEDRPGEAENSDRRSVTVVFCRQQHSYQPQAHERLIETIGSHGIILIRVLMNDPEDESELASIMKQQQRDRVESVPR